jgi:hypothetical protein
MVMREARVDPVPECRLGTELKFLRDSAGSSDMQGHDREVPSPEDRRFSEHFRALYHEHRRERERSGEVPSNLPEARPATPPAVSITARVTSGVGLAPTGTAARSRAGASEEESSTYMSALRRRFARAAREGADEAG